VSITNFSDPLIINEKTGSFMVKLIELIDPDSGKPRREGKWRKKREMARKTF
jgi:hypothetical protein